MPIHNLTVFDARRFVVVSGANLGDPVAEAGQVELSDVFTLLPDSHPQELQILPTASPTRFTISPESQAGAPGATVFLDCLLTLMAGDGTTHEAIILVETMAGMVEATYLLPLGNLQPQQELALISIDKSAAQNRFAMLACVSFARGTRLLMADGRQCPIEDIEPGQRVMTRDHGPQPVRWIGQQTTRGTGDLAPVVIRKGTFGNNRDLTVCPNHRLFVYQRSDQLGAGRAEVMVAARMLVNGDDVRQVSCGYVDYYQLMFDSHEIVYAECIAAESLMTSGVVHAQLATGPAAPDPQKTGDPQPVGAADLTAFPDQPNIVSLIRKATAG